MTSSTELFGQYLKNNVQLGMADIFEVAALTEGQNLQTTIHEAQLGLSDGFDHRPLLEALRVALPDCFVQCHISRSKTNLDVYFYYHKKTEGLNSLHPLQGRNLVGISLLNVSTDKSRSTTIATEQVTDQITTVFDSFIVDDHHPCFVLRITPNGISETRRSIRKSTTPKAKDIHYPFLKDDLTDYFDKFLASDSSILLLIGPAGTGKSTFTRSLILHTQQPASLVYDPDTIMASSTLDHFYSSTHRILAVEDADAFLGKREEGNQHLAGYLNYADGIIKDPAKKLVISTNLGSTSKIDSALIRKGRCYDILTFRPLTQTEIDIVREAAGLEPKLFSQDAVLAEALDKGGEELEQRRSAPLGFIER